MSQITGPSAWVAFGKQTWQSGFVHSGVTSIVGSRISLLMSNEKRGTDDPMHEILRNRSRAVSPPQLMWRILPKQQSTRGKGLQSVDRCLQSVLPNWTGVGSERKVESEW